MAGGASSGSAAATRPALNPGAVRVERLHRLQDVAADWQAIEATGTCTAFQSIHWLAPFYRELAPALGLKPLFLKVTDRETGRLLMLWPLVQRRWLGLTQLQFADAGICDYNAPLLCGDWPRGDLAGHPAWRNAWLDARDQMLSMPGLGALLQADKTLPELQGVANPLFDAGPASGRNPRATTMLQIRPMSFGRWAVDLPASFEAFQQQHLSASFLKDLAMRRRRLDRKGAVRFTRATTEAERRDAFATLVQQRARRFAETDRHDLLAEPAFRRCYEAAAVDAPGDKVRLFSLQVDAARVAVLLAIDHGGTRHVVMPTFEAGEWKNCSPGNLLLLMAIEDAIGAGMNRFDFTIGDEAYKASFGATRQPVLALVQAMGWPGLGYIGARQGLRTLRDRWRDRWRDQAHPQQNQQQNQQQNHPQGHDGGDPAAARPSPAVLDEPRPAPSATSAAQQAAQTRPHLSGHST